MGEPSRIGRRTGRPRTLDAEQIVAAARAVGVADFTMPAVASRLGVSHSTLYRYFADRDGLALAAINQIVAECRWPAPAGDWRAAVTEFADALWSAFERNPGLARASWEASTIPDAVVPVLHALGAHVVAHGFTPRDAVLLLDFVSDLALSTFVLMGHLDRPAASTPGSPSVRESYQSGLGRIPLLGSAIPAEIWHGRGWFDEKLTIFLDGFAVRQEARNRDA
ncbi:TetR/AcrR family transcriptional regulator [Phytohabitans sp. ZYX-F-186]|uniref:TetR/AcrR family transcriptional regulator n=1 Tax=Phytohabitans maris TaxID=3071409 RepID=A0ABU0ZS89_9ACTN|nr:TetR/AcrR family transcriptional regulator [Phytohabitans sp. ZYX-F-186]MDQ7909889.1 TetR/AcrR family transcriptional regulator [Phytohabitans sp. ZYX-F-186]